MITAQTDAEHRTEKANQFFVNILQKKVFERQYQTPNLLSEDRRNSDEN